MCQKLNFETQYDWGESNSICSTQRKTACFFRKMTSWLLWIIRWVFVENTFCCRNCHYANYSLWVNRTLSLERQVDDEFSHVIFNALSSTNKIKIYTHPIGKTKTCFFSLWKKHSLFAKVWSCNNSLRMVRFNSCAFISSGNWLLMLLVVIYDWPDW